MSFWGSNGGNNDPMNPANSSVPLPCGGDTHAHLYGQNENDYVITTQIPISDGLGSINIHDKKDDSDFNWKP